MSLEQLESFVAIADEGHVGRAAKRLHISQPPLSRRIQRLEDELGTQLFERTPKGMSLMPAGQAFLEHAQGILSAVDAARCAMVPFNGAGTLGTEEKSPPER